jgi:hypothetical protein
MVWRNICICRKADHYWDLISMSGIHVVNIDHLNVVTVFLHSEVNDYVIHVMLPNSTQDSIQASVIIVRLKETIYGIKHTE